MTCLHHVDQLALASEAHRWRYVAVVMQESLSIRVYAREPRRSKMTCSGRFPTWYSGPSWLDGLEHLYKTILAWTRLRLPYIRPADAIFQYLRSSLLLGFLDSCTASITL